MSLYALFEGPRDKGKWYFELHKGPENSATVFGHY